MHRPLLVLVGLTLLAGGCLELGGIDADPTADGATADSPAADGTASPPTAANSSDLNGTLAVHYLDVGQADATVLQFPDGETMLVDSGDWREDGEAVIDVLRSRDIDRIDHLVATHPHADHIGGHAAVIEYLETEGEGVGAAYDSGVAHTSGTYEAYLDAIERHDVALFTVQAGDDLAIGNASIRFLNPPARRIRDDLNGNSISFVLTYRETTFLFTGDLEGAGERRLVANWPSQLDGDVYQAGHHGSQTSSSPAFLDAVRPSVVVISSALSSRYGHPDNETLAAFAERGVETYWTAVHGTVTVRSNGSAITVETATEGPTDPETLRALRANATDTAPSRLGPSAYVTRTPTRTVP